MRKKQVRHFQWEGGKLPDFSVETQEKRGRKGFGIKKKNNIATSQGGGGGVPLNLEEASVGREKGETNIKKKW